MLEAQAQKKGNGRSGFKMFSYIDDWGQTYWSWINQRLSNVWQKTNLNNKKKHKKPSSITSLEGHQNQVLNTFFKIEK